VAAREDQGGGEPAGGRIALVLAGGGARGAYEMGALSVLAPVLEARGEEVEIIVGTSIGGINAAFLAANAHRPLSEAAARGEEVWRGLQYRSAMRSIISPAGLLFLIRFIGTLLSLPVKAAPSLLDTAPLRKTLNRVIEFARLRAIDFVEAKLTNVHVLASGAIPVIFPAVEVTEPASCRGWYGDGGLRLNAPLDPALALGADRVIVIGLNSAVIPDDRPTPTKPDLFDGASSLLSVLADQLTSDVAELTAINEAITHGEDGAHRKIPYIFIVPSDRLTIGRIAVEVYKRRYKSVAALLRTPNLALLGRITDAARNPMHGELYSYLFLCRDFVDEMIALGRADAQRWLDAEHDQWPWRIGRPTEV